MLARVARRHRSALARSQRRHKDNLLQTYKSSALAALAALRGQSMTGTWRLRVADLGAVDIGKLNRWSLRIDRQA